MASSSVSRRDLIRWAVSSVILAPVSGIASPPAIARWGNAPIEDQCDLLFRNHLPGGTRKVASQAASNVHAAIFESEVQEEARFPFTRRWLCIGCEVSPGQFAVQTSKDVLADSTSFHPVEASVSVLETGEVEVFEQGLRWSSTEHWHRKGDLWQLSTRKSVGVSGGMFFEEEYDQLRQELVVSRGRIEDDDLLSTERYATPKVFALGEYTRGSLA